MSGSKQFIAYPQGAASADRPDGIGDQEEDLRRSNADWQLCHGICEDQRVSGYLQRSCSLASFPSY
jgi:hypothetical protein